MPDATDPSPGAVWHEGGLPRAERWDALGLRAATVWLTGLSGSGKTAVGTQLARLLVLEGRLGCLLDADELRGGLLADLGPGPEADAEESRRLGEVARLVTDAGVVAIVASISPRRAHRARVRAAHRAAGLGLIEVWVNTPVPLCEERDPHRRYERARAGELTGVAGLDVPYEVPLDPDLELVPEDGSSLDLARAVHDRLANEHFSERPDPEGWAGLEPWTPRP